MISSDYRKKMVDSWFSYLQIQICKSFEILEKNKLKFSKRDWLKKNIKEGGGTSYLLTNGKIFDKVGVNKSTVSGIFPKKFRNNILGAENHGRYWASGVSVVAHMKNPKMPAIHFKKFACRIKKITKNIKSGVMNIFIFHIEKKLEVLAEFFSIMKLKIGLKTLNL